MKEKDHDYNPLLAILCFWVMMLAMTQCESERALNNIARELSDIEFQLELINNKFRNYGY